MMKEILKKRALGIVPAVLLIGIVTFFTADVAYSLYEPDRTTAETPECGMATISGDVTVMQKDGLTWDVYNSSSVLEPGSRLRTSETSRASITFSPGTTTTLEPGTDLIIDTIEPGNDANGDTVILKQRSGTTWNQVAPRDIPQDFILQTNSAVMKVKGTSFLAEIDEDGKTIVTSSEGLVQVYAEGETVDLPAGYVTEIEEGKPPLEPYPIPLACNELSFSSASSVTTLVTAPSGTSTGFLTDGSAVNQISGAVLYSLEDIGHTVYLREPEPGNYTLTMTGVPGNVYPLQIEGYIAGESAFVKTEDITMNTNGKKVLYFSYSDLAAGVDPAASSDANNPDGSGYNIQQPAGLNTENSLDVHSDGQSSPAVLRWIVITFIVIVAGGMVYWVRQN